MGAFLKGKKIIHMTHMPFLRAFWGLFITFSRLLEDQGNKIKCIQASREGPKALPWKAPLFFSWKVYFIVFFLDWKAFLLSFIFFFKKEGGRELRRMVGEKKGDRKRCAF